MLCILLTELDTKGENEKARKQEQRENKAKWQRDDTVNLEHRNTHRAHDSLPEYSSVHTNINSQIKLPTYCLLEASAFITAGSQRSVSLLRQEGQEVWYRKLIFNGKDSETT